MIHEKTFNAISKLKEIEIELHRLKNALEMANKALDAKREWVGLTDEDFQPMVHKAMMYYGYDPKHSTLTSGAGFYELVRAVEAKLKQKNGYAEEKNT